MILNFKTKTDINGNTYQLFVDPDKRQYGYYRNVGTTEDIVVTRKRMRTIRDNAKAEGYTEV